VRSSAYPTLSVFPRSHSLVHVHYQRYRKSEIILTPVAMQLETILVVKDNEANLSVVMTILEGGTLYPANNLKRSSFSRRSRSSNRRSSLCWSFASFGIRSPANSLRRLAFAVQYTARARLPTLKWVNAAAAKVRPELSFMRTR